MAFDESNELENFFGKRMYSTLSLKGMETYRINNRIVPDLFPSFMPTRNYFLISTGTNSYVVDIGYCTCSSMLKISASESYGTPWSAAI